ncbi:MAG TPA: DinB family protein [Saprospiraceae bacterium]|jgi:DinB family protein
MIPVDIPSVISILTRTPATVRELVSGLDEHWLHAVEGPDTWTPHQVVAHLIYGEQTDWIPRMRIILDESSDKKFIPFDRTGHFPIAAGRSIDSLLHQFEQLRIENILILLAADLTEDDLRKEGIHPAFGPVTLGQLLASWVVHDMTHIYQISRIIAKQYEVEVGPWKEYMRILK